MISGMTIIFYLFEAISSNGQKRKFVHLHLDGLVLTLAGSLPGSLYRLRILLRSITLLSVGLGFTCSPLNVAL